MLSREDLLEQLEQVAREKAQAEANAFRCEGALNLIRGQLNVLEQRERARAEQQQQALPQAAA